MPVFHTGNNTKKFKQVLDCIAILIVLRIDQCGWQVLFKKEKLHKNENIFKDIEIFSIYNNDFLVYKTLQNLGGS